jgi:DNA repair exonuclease SbcCD ATPase subunit
LKIINLQAENVKKLTAVDITPTENMVRITGPNGAGKSSVLDCIVMALCGGKAIPPEPIKKGRDKGKVVIDLGEYTVTRSFTKDGSYLKIASKEGMVIKSPQKFLDTIVGNISFDPLDFLNNEDKKQRDILMSLVGIDTTDIDAQEKKLREDRTLLGRQRDAVKADHDNIQKTVPEKTPEVEVDIVKLSEKLQEGIAHNASIIKETADNENLKKEAMGKLDQIKIYKERKEEYLAKIKEADDLIESLTEEVRKMKEKFQSVKKIIESFTPVNVDEIKKQMSSVELINQGVRNKKQWLKLKEELNTLNKKYEGITHAINDIASTRSNMLNNAKMPVAGLTFDDGGLIFNGIPLSQASDGEKLMVSLAISMAINPTLRVLRIKDGSLLDPSNRKIINDMINEKDYQLWFESVGTDADVGILIEEGEIIKVNGNLVAATSPEVDSITPQEVTESETDWPSVSNTAPQPKKEVEW